MVAHLFDAAGNLVLWARVSSVRDIRRSFDRLLGVTSGRHPGVEMFAFLVEDDVPPRAHFFNPDRTLERLCGNAIRCLPLLTRLQTDGHVRVRIGDRECLALRSQGQFGFRIPEADVVVWQAGAGMVVDAGSPHLVLRAESMEALDVNQGMFDVRRLGFNITYVRLIEREARVTVRTLERGVGETMSCGTGAIAAYVGSASQFGMVPWRGRAGQLNIVFASGRRLQVTQEMGSLTVIGECREVAQLSLAS